MRSGQTHARLSEAVVGLHLGWQLFQIADQFHFFCFNATTTTEIYTLSLHDALPICPAKMIHRMVPKTPTHNNFERRDRKSTRLNSSHVEISYAVFCLKKKKSEQHVDVIFPSARIEATGLPLHL